jgi:predicted enzyme related to lactoylglutathione lyase
MAEFTSYAPGTPCWVDLAASDPDAASAFYTSLFGWEVQDLGPDAGGYRMALKDGKLVAGLGPLVGEGQPPAWSTYVSVEDVDATLAKATAAGAQVIAPAMDVMQAGQHIGAQLANEPGSFTWNELNTRDTEAAIAFYTAVFGWRAETNDMGGMAYTEWKLDDRSIAGMMPMPEQVPAQVPAHWLAYFSVEDCDAAVDAINLDGGKVIVGPMDVPPGRFAVASDPQGAVFAVIAPPVPAPDSQS